jgi:hypothetical protein
MVISERMRKIAFILLITVSLSAKAQIGRKMTRAEYIDTYKELAMMEMERTGIPASITLAQGIFESGDGNSRLARKANNHFGIKCHDWNGKTIYHDDDSNNECFRKYKSVEESYRDHSDFLTSGSRYAFLFEYDREDYKMWAKGLKDAGYATNASYPQALVKVIEDNELYKYDKKVLAMKEGNSKEKAIIASTEYAGGRKIFYNNRVKYVIAREGDHFSSLSEELDLLSWQLPKYNDLQEDTYLKEEQIIYLQPKRNRAEAGKKVHLVQKGETLHSISQLYAIKIRKLASRNLLNVNDTLTAGEELWLRKKKKGERPEAATPRIQLKEEEPADDFKVRFDLDN